MATIESVRMHFPGVKRMESEGWIFFENAGGSQVKNSMIRECELKNAANKICH